MSERRQYFRIDIAARVILQPCEAPDITDPYAESLPVPPELGLLRSLHDIDREQQEALHLLNTRDRVLASYLRAQDEKINLTAQQVVQAALPVQPLIPAVLSERGLGCHLPSTKLSVGASAHLIVQWPDMRFIFAVLASVRHCSADGSSPATSATSHIGVEFIHLHDQDRRQLVRCLRKAQLNVAKRDGDRA